MERAAPGMQTVRGMIRSARGTATQKEFGAALGGLDQALISRYESGQADPPARVVDACIAILHRRSGVRLCSADVLARRIKAELGGDEHQDLRRALMQLLDGLRPRAVGRPKGKKI